MGDCETVSCFKLNKKLAESLGYRCSTVPVAETGVQVLVDGEERTRVVDYCYNWGDIMPVATKLNVFFSPLAWERCGELYRANWHVLVADIENEPKRMVVKSYKFAVDDQSALRALTICCTKVLQAMSEGACSGQLKVGS